MKYSSQSVFITSGRSAYGVFVPVFVVFMVLAWGASFDGPAYRIRPDYWRVVVPVAIPLSAFIAWRLQKALIGTWYTPRYTKEKRQMGRAESWQMGVIVAAVLVGIAAVAFANVMNQVIGVPYTATYAVAEKYIHRGKHTCYGLIIAKVGDSQDRFQTCVPERQQQITAIGEKLEVSGRRSKYVNQVLSFAPKVAD